MKLAIGGLALATALAGTHVHAQTMVTPAKVQAASADNGVLHVARGTFPRTERIEINRGKSLMVEFPFRLRDVLVSDPGRLDAVVQSSNRVFLLGKRLGEVNVFFFNEAGDHVLTLDVDVGAGKGLLSSSDGKERSVERALQSLNDLLSSLVPGSKVISKRVGHSIILTGTVPSPAAAARAATVAREYARAWINQSERESVSMSSSSSEGSWARNGGGDSAAGRSSRESDSESHSRTSTNPNQKDDNLVINLLTIEGEEQVMLQVVVAEVQRSIMKQFGINLGAAINAGNFSTTLLTENALPLTAAAGLGRLPIPGIGTQGLSPGDPITCTTAGVLCNWNPGPSGGTFGNSGLNGGIDTGSGRISYAMRMLERDGLLRTLAEPNLTAVSGETAKFLAGGEYPVPVVDTDGRLSVQYKEFGVGLAFTPVVLSEGRVSLKIETEVSELSDVGAVTLNSISIPALKKRQARSTVELPSGGTLALAGLLSEDTRKNIDGFPGLKDVPVIGTLFRSNDYIKRETELVVLVTPYMVKPVARKKLARPDDGLAPASDLKFNFLGHLNRVYGKEIPPPVHAGLKDGGIGFIID